MLYSETWYPVGLQLIVEIPRVSKVRYPDLVVTPSWATHAIPTSGSCSKFSPHPLGTCITSPSRAMISSTLSGGLPNLSQQRGHIFQRCDEKGNNKVENKLEGLVGLGIFVLFTLSSSHVIGFSNGLVTHSSWGLINFIDGDSFLSPNFPPSAQQSTTNLSEALPPWVCS